ncbi:MAG: IS6 family transposase, partial [Bacteroidota bacterium]
LTKPTLGFKSFASGRATIAGFEVMRMFRKGQFKKIKTLRQEGRSLH